MKVSRKNFAGYGSVITTLEGTGKCSKRGFWSYWGTCGHICYIDQTATLLLGQASLSILYARRLNILKTLLKNPRNANTLLKEKTALLQEEEGHLFDKIFRSHKLEIERPKKKSLEVFKVDNHKNTSFRKGPISYQNRPQGGHRYYYTEKSSNQDKNKNVRFQNNASTSARKFHHVGLASNGKYFFYNWKVPVTSNLELVPLIKIATLEHVHPVIRKLFTKSIRNVPLARRLAYFIEV